MEGEVFGEADGRKEVPVRKDGGSVGARAGRGFQEPFCGNSNSRVYEAPCCSAFSR